jgi:hypothetical protein
MAVGTVSGVNLDEQWQLISSVTPSGTSVTFSSLTGYKHIWIMGNAITKSASTAIGIRPNNDSSVGAYAWAQSGNDSKFYAGVTTTGSSALSFKIYNIDQASPHKIEAVSDSLYSSNGDAYTNPVAITSVTVLTWNGSATFTGGTLAVYGVPA